MEKLTELFKSTHLYTKRFTEYDCLVFYNVKNWITSGYFRGDRLYERYVESKSTGKYSINEDLIKKII